MWIHWPFFPKTWTKGLWPLDDLWPHVCWGHMCDSTQGSLCPSPMTIHQCMWIQWSILQITTYIHTHTTYILRTYYILHTTYRMSDHIVSYWTQFRRDKKYSLTYLRRTVCVVIEEKVKGQMFGSTGVMQVKMIQFCWQLSQNNHQVNTMKNQNI